MSDNGFSGLRDQVIGGEGTKNLTTTVTDGSYFNVYHLLVPYYLGDSRINISPVYIYDIYQTSLSLSKTSVKFGNYFYPTTISPTRLFMLDVNKIVQSDKVLATQNNIKIGENTYTFNNTTGTNTPSAYYIKRDGVFRADNIGLNINKEISFVDGVGNFNANGWQGVSGTEIDFNSLYHPSYGYFNNKVTYVKIRKSNNGPRVPVVINNTPIYGNRNNDWVNMYGLMANKEQYIFVNSDGGYFKIGNAMITGMILNDSTYR